MYLYYRNVRRTVWRTVALKWILGNNVKRRKRGVWHRTLLSFIYIYIATWNLLRTRSFLLFFEKTVIFWRLDLVYLFYSFNLCVYVCMCVVCVLGVCVWRFRVPTLQSRNGTLRVSSSRPSKQSSRDEEIKTALPSESANGRVHADMHQRKK